MPGMITLFEPVLKAIFEKVLTVFQGSKKPEESQKKTIEALERVKGNGNAIGNSVTKGEGYVAGGFNLFTTINIQKSTKSLIHDSVARGISAKDDLEVIDVRQQKIEAEARRIQRVADEMSIALEPFANISRPGATLEDIKKVTNEGLFLISKHQAKVYLQSAISYKNMGLYMRAEEEFAKAYKLDPSNVEIVVEYCKILDALDKSEQAYEIIINFDLAGLTDFEKYRIIKRKGIVAKRVYRLSEANNYLLSSIIQAGNLKSQVTRTSLSEIYFSLSTINNMLLDCDEALENAKIAGSIIYKNFSLRTPKSKNSSLISIYTVISTSYALKGDYQKALEFCLFAKEALESTDNQDPVSITAPKINYAIVLFYCARYDESINQAKLFLDFVHENFESHHLLVGHIDNLLGINYIMKGDIIKAERYFARAGEILKFEGSRNSISRAVMTAHQANAHKKSGNYFMARKLYVEVVEILESAMADSRIIDEARMHVEKMPEGKDLILVY